MLRFILKNAVHDPHSGAQFERVFTIDADVPDLQAALSRGGYGGDSGYDLTSLIGVEAIDVDRTALVATREGGHG